MREENKSKTLNPGKSPEKRVKAEISRLKKLYAGLSPEQKALTEGLTAQAARLRVSLDDLWADICENGDVEMFSQSEKTEPYERERPAARLFNCRDKNYAAIIKQLDSMLPKTDASAPASDGFDEFVGGRGDA